MLNTFKDLCSSLFMGLPDVPWKLTGYYASVRTINEFYLFSSSFAWKPDYTAIFLSLL